ncbi:transcription antitermination factor NusB [Planctomycetota bacterium]
MPPINKQTTARAVAMKVLNRFNPKRNYASVILGDLINQTQEKQRASDLVFGTVRNQIAIDTVITQFADCRIGRTDRRVLNIIRIGSYELIYCPQAAQHAIVNEAVENVKTIGSKKQVGFVNAVLREIIRNITNREVALSKANLQSTLPHTTQAGCQFNKDILPDAEESPAEFLSVRFSLPDWLVAEWIAEFGFEQAEQICFASNRRPSLYVRPNILKTTTEKLAEKFRNSDLDLQIAPDGSMIKIKSPCAITELAGFYEGLFSVQDLTASEPAKNIHSEPGWKILDLCAAPGGKVTQLAELTGDKVQIFATDIDAERLKKVRENIDRLGIKSVTISEYEKVEQLGPFDLVLLDVPCSNTGVLARRIEVRFRVTSKAVKGLVKIQSQLLDTGAAMTNKQGRLCYSSCAIGSEENSRLIERFLKKNQDFELETEKLTLPTLGDLACDGGYFAILIKK